MNKIIIISFFLTLFVFVGCKDDNPTMVNQGATFSCEYPINKEGDTKTIIGSLNINAFATNVRGDDLETFNFEGYSDELYSKFYIQNNEIYNNGSSAIILFDSIDLRDLILSDLNYTADIEREEVRIKIQFNRYFSAGMNTGTATATTVSGAAEFRIIQ
jgi:hypothetical protein